MRKRLTDEQVEKIIDALAPSTSEEADEYLRELGYDPDELVARMLPRIQKAIDESPLNPKNRKE